MWRSAFFPISRRAASFPRVTASFLKTKEVKNDHYSQCNLFMYRVLRMQHIAENKYHPFEHGVKKMFIMGVWNTCV